jgi:hypothetical protein
MVVHATGESLSEPHGPGTYAVVLGGSEAVLQALAAKLRAAGVQFKTIVESDPPWLGQVMAIGITPAAKEVLKPYVSSLPLLR